MVNGDKDEDEDKVEDEEKKKYDDDDENEDEDNLWNTVHRSQTFSTTSSTESRSVTELRFYLFFEQRFRSDKRKLC